MVISTDSVSCAQLRERFPDFFVDSEGDLSRGICGVAAPENYQDDKALFLATPKAIAAGLANSVSASTSVLVVPVKMKGNAELDDRIRAGTTTVLYSPQVEWAMAKVTDAFFLKTPYTNRLVDGVHPSAVISSEAVIEAGVRIGPGAFVGARTIVRKSVYIGANAVIEDQCEIGEGTVIHPLAFIGHSTLIGQRCEVHPQSVVGKEGFGYAHDARWNHARIPHQGRVVLEDDVHIGACCTIDRATFGETRIGAGTKLDNQIHLAHNCRVGRNGLLTAGFTMAGSSRVGSNFVTGGNTVISGHIEIGDNVQLAALSGATKNIESPGQYGGVPVLPLKEFIRNKAASAHLAEMRKQLSRVMKHLGLSDDPDKESPKS